MVAIDALDRQLIDALRSDGRASFGTLGRAVGLTEASARARVHRLQERGVLSVVGMVASTRLGNIEARAMIRVRGVPVRAVVDRLLLHREVMFAAIVVGEYDIVADLSAANLEALSEYLGERVHRIRGVDRIETVTVMDVLKDEYVWWGMTEDAPVTASIPLVAPRALHAPDSAGSET